MDLTFQVSVMFDLGPTHTELIHVAFDFDRPEAKLPGFREVGEI